MHIEHSCKKDSYQKDLCKKNLCKKSLYKKDVCNPILAEQNPYNVYYNNYLNTNAATECTGLSYRMPTTREEWDAYRTVFDFLPVPFQDPEDINDS